MTQFELAPRYPSRRLMQFIISSPGRYTLYTDALVLLTDYVADFTTFSDSARFEINYVDEELARILNYVVRAINRKMAADDRDLGKAYLVEGLNAIAQNIGDNHTIARKIREIHLGTDSVSPTEHSSSAANIFNGGVINLYTNLRIVRRQYVTRSE